MYKTDDVPYYAAPSRATNYSDLPPTYTFVGNIEPFYDEIIKYIDDLKNAVVTAKIDVYDGCFHAFDLFAVKKEIGEKATAKWIEELKCATENYFAKND